MSVINQMLRDLDRRTMPADRTVFAARLNRSSSGRFGWRQFVAAAVVMAVGVTLSVTVANWQGPPERPVTARADAAPLLAVTPAIPDAAAIPAAPIELPLPPIDTGPVRSEPPATRIAPTKPIDAAAKSNVAGTQVTPPARAVNEKTQVAALAVQPPQASRPIASSAPAASESLPATTPESDRRIIREEATRTADSEYRHAAALIDQGRLREAQQRLRGAIDMEPRHEAARQTLAALLLEERSYDAAAEVLAAGLKRNPAQSNFAVALSRLHLERGNLPAAIAVLRDHASYAVAHPEYRAFAAALYARSGAHAEAIGEYEAALKLAPQMGSWWIGLGLAHEAEDRSDAATEAFRRARATGALSASLNQFVERKLQRK